MDKLLQVIAIVVWLVAGLQAITLLLRSWVELTGRRREQGLQLELLKERLRHAAMTRNAEQDALDHGWSGFRKFKIDQKVDEGGGICSFYFAPHDGKPLPPFQPGQYLTFNLKDANREKPVVRCYSLSDSPMQRDYYRISVKRVLSPPGKPELPPGVGSGLFHEKLGQGDIVDVRAPSGAFYLDMSKHTPVVLIGGGIGITPVLSMLNAIAESGSKREVWFFYGIRNGSEHIQAEHLRRIDSENENVKLHICYSDVTEDDRAGIDYTHNERVSVDLFRRLLPSNNYDYYMCGPPPMMAAVVSDLKEWGVPDARIHFEAFGPASVKAQKRPESESAAAPSADVSIDVTFAKSGKTAKWTPAAGSLLDFAEENGVDLDFGCRAGSCGTCVTALKTGEVEYLDEPSSPPEEGTCLACIAQPKSALVIDA